MFTIDEIIDLAVRIEENGEGVYRDAAAKCPDPALGRWFLRLADDEAEHRNWFCRLKEKTAGAPQDPRLQELGRGILQGILGDQAFALRDADFSKMKAIRELVRVSLEFEKDTILFYEMLGPFVEDGSTRDHLQTVIEEERDHVRVLEKALAEEVNVGPVSS